MDDILVAYLLDNLEAEELREVEDRLSRDPDLRDRLTVLQKSLAPLDLDADPEPPPRLVLTTLSRIAEEHCLRPVATRRPPPAPFRETVAPRRWFRRADVLVAALLLVVVGAIGLPWVMRTWQEYQIRACQNNLVVFWHGLQFHSDLNRGAFPQVEADGPGAFAGMVVPILNDNKLLGHDASVLCPAVGKRAPDERSVHELKALVGAKGARTNIERWLMRDVEAAVMPIRSASWRISAWLD